MSSIVNPVGPEEPSTYWRRRAAVIVVLLFIILLGWWTLSSVFGGGDSTTESSPSPSFGLPLSETPDATESASPAATQTASPASSESPSAPSASPSGTDSASASASATGAKCASSVIKVTVATASETTPVGGGLNLTMTVANTGTDPCTRDVGNGANEVRITSAGKLVWSSDHCNPSKDEDEQLLNPTSPWSIPVTWNGLVSTEGCPSSPPQAQAGSYQVVARNGKVESEPVTFTVQ